LRYRENTNAITTFLSCLNKLCAFLLGFLPSNPQVWRKKFAACSFLLPLWSACKILDCGSIALGVLGDGTLLSDVGNGGLLLAYTSPIPVHAAQHDSEKLLFILCITSMDGLQRLQMGKRSSISHFGVLLTQANSARYWLAL